LFKFEVCTFSAVVAPSVECCLSGLIIIVISPARTDNNAHQKQLLRYASTVTRNQ